MARFADDLGRFGDRLAVIDEHGARLTHAELAARADAFAERLGPAPRLLVIETRNDVETLIAYLGALRGRHPVLLWAADDEARLERIRALYRFDARYFEAGGAWHLVLDDLAADRPLHPELALLLSTSGSTGAVKLVRLSHDAIGANAESIRQYLDIGEGERSMLSLPIHYSYGLSIVNSTLAAGGTILMSERSVLEPGFWDFFRQEEANSIAGVPHSYELFDRCGLMDMALPSLRKMLQAGGRLPPQTATRYGAWGRSHGVRLFIMYGQTEAAPRMAYLPPEMLEAAPDCIGVPVPGGAFRLVDDYGAELADGPGELVYRGPNVMMGYAFDAGDLALGRGIDALHTGDMAVRTEAGLYRIVGRKSRFIKPFGLRIGLDEVEAELLRRGWGGIATGNDELLAVAMTSGPEPGAAAVELGAAFGLPPERIGVLEMAELPLLPSGKYDYGAVLRAVQAKRDAPARPVSRNAVTAIEQAYAAAFPARQLAPDDSFVSLNGDSLSYVGLSLAIEEALGFLPDGWEEMRLAEIAAIQPIGHGRVSLLGRRAIEADALVRALAIFAVVLHHATLWPMGGAANVMLLLAGYNLMRFSEGHLIAGRGWKTLGNFFCRVVLPLLGLLAAYAVHKRGIDPEQFLLIQNITGRYISFMGAYWFIAVLFQLMLFYALLFSIPAVRRFAANNAWAFAILMLGLGLLLRWIAFGPGLEMREEVLRHAAGRAPDARLYAFAFGWALAAARTSDQKWTLLLVGIGISLSFWNAEGPGMVFPINLQFVCWWMLATVALLWFPRMAVPRLVFMPLMLAASASFYIYFVHMGPILLLRDKLHIDVAAVHLLLGIGLGVVLWRLEQWAAPRLSTWMQRLRPPVMARPH